MICVKAICFFFRDERVPLLTHCGRVTHICISKLTITSSDNGLLPGGGQAIIWTNAGILLISTLGTDFSEISIEIDLFSFQRNAFDKVICKMSLIVSQLQYVKNLSSSGWNLTKRRDESDYDITAIIKIAHRLDLKLWLRNYIGDIKASQWVSTEVKMALLSHDAVVL